MSKSHFSSQLTTPLLLSELATEMDDHDDDATTMSNTPYAQPYRNQAAIGKVLRPLNEQDELDDFEDDDMLLNDSDDIMLYHPRQPKTQRKRYGHWNDGVSPRKAWLRWIRQLLVPRGRLSPFRGVYVPACIGIVGPILFLRMPYVISEAGFGLSCVMILLIFCIALLTIAGVAPIVTNGRMISGGPYYLISRTLGVELGGAIGLLLLFEHLIGAIYYLYTFEEILRYYREEWDIKQYNRQVTVASGSLFVCLCLAMFGPRGYSTVAVGFYFIKLVALVLVITSFFVQSPSHDIPTDCISSHDYNKGNFTALDYLTGPKRSTFASNIGNHEREGSDQLHDTNFANFLDLFSIVFAAFSGFLSGVNLTGEVRNPGCLLGLGRAMPAGMFWAATTGLGFFLIMAVTVSWTVYALDCLADPKRAVITIALSKEVVLAGMLACCFGTATVHLLAASNTVRRMSMDGMLPFLTLDRFPWLSSKRTFFSKRWHIFVAWYQPVTSDDKSHTHTPIARFMMQCLAFMGSPDKVAPMLSLTYLFFTSVVNMAILLLLMIGAPNFRPSYRYWNKYTAIAGAVLPLIVMVGINSRLSLMFIGVFILLVVLFGIFAPPTDFGDVSRAIIYHQVRKYLLRLDEATTATTAKFWRPSPLFISTQSPEFFTPHELNLARLSDSMKKGGLYVLTSFVFGEFNAESVHARQEQLRAWQGIVSRERFKALPVVSITEKIQEGVRHSLMMTGLGPVKPNLVMLPWIDANAALTPPDFVAVIRDVTFSDLNCVLGCNFDRRSTASFGVYQQGFGRAGMKHSTSSNGQQVDETTSLTGSHGSVTSEKAKRSVYNMDLWMVPVAMPGNEQWNGSLWDEYTLSLGMMLQLANTLRLNKHWKHQTRLRLFVAVNGTHDDVAKERKRWLHFLQLVRVSADLEIVRLMPEAEEHRAELFGETAQDHPTRLVDEGGPVSPTRSSSVSVNGGTASSVRNRSYTMDDPIGNPSLNTASSFFSKLTVKQRLQLVKLIVQKRSNETCLAMMALCPPPDDKDETSALTYFSELSGFIRDLPPTLLIHAKVNVIHTDL